MILLVDIVTSLNHFSLLNALSKFNVSYDEALNKLHIFLEMTDIFGRWTLLLSNLCTTDFVILLFIFNVAIHYFLVSKPIFYRKTTLLYVCRTGVNVIMHFSMN